jgi:hypothetical protein
MDQAAVDVEESSKSLFQPDTLLPEQFVESLRRKPHLDPETKLMLAVLEDAVSCFTKNRYARHERGKRAFDEAKQWICDRDSDWPFSFENICEVLGLDPEYMRSGLVGGTGAKPR